MVVDDPWLEPHHDVLLERLQRFRDTIDHIEKKWDGLEAFANMHNELGFIRDESNQCWRYTEWAPRAKALHLIGDFNDWNGESHPLEPVGNGCWAIQLSDGRNQRPQLVHGQRVKVRVAGKNGVGDRIPPLVRRAVQDPESLDFAGQIWAPPEEYPWSDEGFVPRDEPLLIYEVHVGMAQEKQGVGSYVEFTENVLPRIAASGHNTIQIMAVQEHPYYASFGYHVANFFAPSSRFGTPEELKALIDRAHSLGLTVLLDIVHSHAVANHAEGLAAFDGSEGLYFHEGDRGRHEHWGSRLFHYAREEVRRFLLSNVRYWIEEFHFDGFRFDGVTSMLYHHHGYASFDSLASYFGPEVDDDAVLYLQLAAATVGRIKPNVALIAEDMSGMPGMCRPIDEGGLGFTHRLAMGIPDFWIKLIKHKRDEEWLPGELWNVLTNRRPDENNIAYCESHDQALVGDKTLAFRLMDSKMYTHMSRLKESHEVDRGIALHKLIRLMTLAAGGEGYLTFMGNEFGHPEWVDFPREGNGWSYHHARRQWSLVDDGNLRYGMLAAFDRAMLKLAAERRWLDSGPAEQLHVDQENQVLVFARGGDVFVFSFNPVRSIADYEFQVPVAGSYRILLSSDDEEFGGHARIDTTQPCLTGTGTRMIRVYLPTRTALVLSGPRNYGLQ